MKIVCVLGSPRPKGNTAYLAERFCETARNAGAEIVQFSLNKLTYKGCQGCMTCKTKLDRCVIKDDLAQVLDAVRDADILVLASPVYYGEVSSQMKGFIDRTFSYLKPDYMTNPAPSRLPPGKKLVFILAQAQPDEKLFADIFPRYEMFFKWYGFQDSRLIRACGVGGPGEVSEMKQVVELAEKTAQSLMSK
jgi:multimeric flavodoxin WrbA